MCLAVEDSLSPCSFVNKTWNAQMAGAIGVGKNPNRFEVRSFYRVKYMLLSASDYYGEQSQ